MGLTIGDTIFAANGKPGVVTEKDPKSGRLTVEKEGDTFEKQRRLGYVNGLPAERRGEFNQILSEVRDESDPRKQIALLTQKIEELRVDPRNHILAKYLESEMAHIMNTEGIQPRTYTVPADSVRI